MDHLGVFHEVARALTQTLELEEILLIIMQKMAQFFGPERWSMLMVDEEAQDLFYAIAVGEDSQSLKGLRVPLGEGVAGWVASTGNPLVVPDVSLDTRWDAFSRAHPELRIRSIACIPIRSGEKTLGVIQLLNTKLDLESEYSISFLRILCDYAAIAIQNARSVKLIHELTITDDCTGLFNARHLYTLLDEQIELAATIPETRFSLLFVDLDHFKLVNDTHGHLIGSRLLAEVGGLMRRALGPANSCFRYGGDEFVALLPGLEKQPAIDATMKPLGAAPQGPLPHRPGPLPRPRRQLRPGHLPRGRGQRSRHHPRRRHHDVRGQNHPRQHRRRRPRPAHRRQARRPLRQDRNHGRRRPRSPPPLATYHH